MLFCFALGCEGANDPYLQRLIDGNERFVEAKMKNPNQTPERRVETIAGQEPFAAIVGCADSRVPPEIIFDQGIGDLFVVRVAGNVIGPIELDSIHFAALGLGSSVILVMGHQDCGAVNAVVQGNAKGIEAVANLIEPSVEMERRLNAKNLLEASIKQNAQQMRDLLLKSPALQAPIKDKKLTIYAGYYNKETGRVEILD